MSFLGRDGLKRILAHPIAFHACLVDVSGSVNASVMLSQAIYWSTKSSESDGSFWKGQKDSYEETRLSRWEQDGPRKQLRNRTFWTERYDRLHHRQYYRVDFDALEEALLSESGKTTFRKEEKPHSGRRNISRRECWKATEVTVENQQSSKEQRLLQGLLQRLPRDCSS